VAALRSAVAQADVAIGQPNSTALLEMIEGAREAVAHLPQPEMPTIVARQVLASLGPRGKGDLWLLSPSALEPWQRAARQLAEPDEGGAGLLPELRTDFWK
jgi:hypothetical protein